MGIVSFCPQGHRVKVKDHLAGKKGVCPTCGGKFRIPLASAEPVVRNAGEAALPLARIVSHDGDLAARLPRALRLETPTGGGTGGDEPEHDDEILGDDSAQPQPPDPATRHPAISSRPDLAWCLAVPGGTASEPLTAEAMQAWLESRQTIGNELVWRADWPEWLPIGQVFPEYARSLARGKSHP
jgi:hypothetical protein